MKIPLSAFVHFGLVELSPIWMSYLSLRSLGAGVVYRARASTITIEGLCGHVAIANNSADFDGSYTVKDLENCLEQSVLRDEFQKSPAEIIHEELSCGQIGFHLHQDGILKGSAGLINWASCAITSLSLIGSLLLFLTHGALGDASDFRSGHYLAFTWALERLVVYKILVGLHVGFYATLAIALLATVSESRHYWPGLVIMAISSMSLLSTDRPPLKWGSSEFRNSTFNRPWYKFYQSNNKFACKGLAEYLTDTDHAELSRAQSIISDPCCCHVCQLANDGVSDNVSDSSSDMGI